MLSITVYYKNIEKLSFVKFTHLLHVAQGGQKCFKMRSLLFY